MPFLGDCAVRHMGAFLQKLESELYPALARKRTGMPVVPEGARQSTLNINAIHGGLPEDREGLPAPLVPDSCRLVLDRRYLIEEDPAAVKQEIVDLLDALKHDRKGFDYALREVLAFQPTMTDPERSEEHTSELQSLMRISYAVFCLKKKKRTRR